MQPRAEAQARQARANRWPGLSLSMSFSQSTYGLERTGLFDFYPDTSRGGGASFGITIPVFPRFREQDAVPAPR